MLVHDNKESSQSLRGEYRWSDWTLGLRKFSPNTNERFAGRRCPHVRDLHSPRKEMFSQEQAPAYGTSGDEQIQCKSAVMLRTLDGLTPGILASKFASNLPP